MTRRSRRTTRLFRRASWPRSMLSLNIVKTDAMTPAIAGEDQRTEDEPRHHADHAAGRNRAEQPPQHAAKHAAEDEHDDDGKRIERIEELGQGRILILARPLAAAPAPAMARRRSRR